MKITDNETRWGKIGEISSVTFVNRDTIMFGTGCHLIFINLQSNEELVYTANHQKVGDGVSCFTGHRTQNIFAFAEKRTNPTVFVKTYPNFDDVYQFGDVEPRGYKEMVFTDTLLLTLGGLPDFNLTVWNWRKGEKLANKNTTICVSNQMIMPTLSSPTLMAQLGVGTNDLHIWDILICGRKTILTQHTVKLTEKYNPFVSMFWTTENTLFVLDSEGCVFIMVAGHHLERVITFEGEGHIVPSFLWYKAGVLVFGPNDEMRHYNKTGNWSVDWTVPCTDGQQWITSRVDYLVAVTETSEILQWIQSQGVFHKIRTDQSGFRDFCFINPVGDYVVTLCTGNVLNMYEVATGDLMSTLTLDKDALVLVENPRFPYIAVGLDKGRLALFSCYNPKEITSMAEFFLCKEPIDSVYFNECGTVFVAANLTNGWFFILEGIPGGQIDVLTKIKAPKQIANFMMILSENCYRIFCIAVTSKKYVAGNRILRYCYLKDGRLNFKEYHFQDKNVLYRRLCAISGIERGRKFYAIPLWNKMIAEVEIKKGSTLATVTERIATGHQMKDIHLKRDKNVFMTWASDGFIILRSSDLTSNIAMALPHHRMQGGVKKASIDPQYKYVISLGRDGVLVCTNLMEKQINPEKRQRWETLLKSADYRLMFSKQTIGYIPKGVYEGKCYLEVEELKKREKEFAECQRLRNDIMNEFRSIQAQLQMLVTENLEGPDNEKLNMLEFNLNKKLHDDKCHRQARVRAATEVYLRRVIAAQNVMSDYIMANCWRTMEIPETTVRGIFCKFKVKNYPLQPTNALELAAVDLIREHRKIDKHFGTLNYFYPWEPINEEYLAETVDDPPHFPTNVGDVVQLAEINEIADEIPDQSLEERETEIAYFGSELFRHLESENLHYNQLELTTYFQMERQWRIVKNDIYKLKLIFNDKFNGMMMHKEKEMDKLLERNARLRHVVSEINYFSEEKISVRIEDPEWVQVEKPENIIEVKDDEVPITPYISPSEQIRLDAKAAEEERIRLLLLADDFRERALMMMMNGVLEVRWEDELRKDVSLPKCMIEKEPENFNEEDLRAVWDYELKVEFLMSERRRYKSMLRAEYKKVSHNIREQIKRFNKKLGDLVYSKLLMEATINQEALKILRTKLFQHNKAILNKRQIACQEKIEHSEEVVRSLHKLIGSLHEAVGECRATVESSQLKDKLMEKNFKRDFMDMTLVVQEQASKLYKKRPKVIIRSTTTSTVLHELAKCIISNAKPPPTLSQDCVEYLKSLDHLDQYIGIPTVVDEHTYAMICKHRRLRIEYEIKIKAVQCEQAEAEATVSAFHRRLGQKKDIVVKLMAELQRLRTAEGDMLKNREIQVVIARGLVETPLLGILEDYDDCVMVCRKDVEGINAIISEFGEKKIQSMQRGMVFKRKILAKEWEHRKMKLQIQDLEEKLVDIAGVKLTKEMQAYLKNKEKDKAMPFESEVDMIKASYENTIQERSEKVKRMKKQIKSLQAQNEALDQSIAGLNVDICEINMYRDKNLSEREKYVIDTRMKTLLRRTNMIQRVQDNHHELLVLQTELELLRLKTFPTLKWEVSK